MKKQTKWQEFLAGLQLFLLVTGPLFAFIGLLAMALMGLILFIRGLL